MAAIRKRKRHGLTVVSTFSGCGGSSLGYRMAGFDVVWASEFVEAAREVYKANFPNTPVDERDIRDVSPGEILRVIGKSEGELDLLDGSPPCASFSMAGKRQRAWGKEKKYSDRVQRADDLFFEYIRVLRGLKPRAFVAENVKGLVVGKAIGYFQHIMKELKASGYRVRAQVLDAQWLGVPQHRERVIFIGLREDLETDPRFPTPLKYRYSIRDALPYATHMVQRACHGVDVEHPGDEPFPTVTTVGMGAKNRYFLDLYPDESIVGTAIGKEWPKLGPGESSQKYFQLVRPDENAPCPTITASGGGRGVAGVTHPTQPRKFTIDELKRICAFPDDFVLTGSFNQQWERLGRSVPPIMMERIARAVASTLK